MYPELIAATYIVARWNYLETDITFVKRFMTHIVVPYGESMIHHARDILCGSRKPKPGMRPPPLQRPSSSSETNAQEE